MNADIGEGAPFDKELLAFISSCNIACGGHAGDHETIIKTLTMAEDYNVAVGAHPSYPDREGFGRRTIMLSDDALKTVLQEQLTSFCEYADMLKIKVTHVKPHGALYHDCAAHLSLASIFAQTVKKICPYASLVGLPQSSLEKAASISGLRFIAEGFADRAYTDDGSLVPRSNPNAILSTDSERSKQAINLAANKRVQTLPEHYIPIDVQSICLHSDSPGAVSSAKAIKNALQSENIIIQSPYHDL